MLYHIISYYIISNRLKPPRGGDFFTKHLGHAPKRETTGGLRPSSTLADWQMVKCGYQRRRRLAISPDLKSPNSYDG